MALMRMFQQVEVMALMRMFQQVEVMALMRMLGCTAPWSAHLYPRDWIP